MTLTPEQKEIALRVASECGTVSWHALDDMMIFAARFLAALPKPGPVAITRCKDIGYAMEETEVVLLCPVPYNTELYTHLPIQSAQPDAADLLSIYETMMDARQSAQPDAAALRDAERYQFLRDNWTSMRSAATRYSLKLTIGQEKWADFGPEVIDSAIDATIAAAKGGAA